MPPRVAFYPCCEFDVEEPLRLLKPFADEVIFCDIKLAVRAAWSRRTSKLKALPSSFVVGDVRKVLDTLPSIDVLFYRGDSAGGEGGSGVFILGDEILPRILDRFRAEGGLIITDGSNSRGGNFRKMCRREGPSKHGWLFNPLDDEVLSSHGLWKISVRPSPDKSC